MRHDTAGDPITGVKWSRRTTRKIAEQLAALGIAVSKNTVGRLLKNMDCKLRVYRQQIASTKNPDGNQQFLYMGQQRERFASQGLPIISVDTKKKEPIGNFKNTGAKWDRAPVLVKDHDFRSDADGMAIPYGIYDTQANRGAVFVGTSHDTPAFAVDAIAQWWLKEGCQRYPTAHELFILADGGGSNGPRCRAWRRAIQDTIRTLSGSSLRSATIHRALPSGIPSSIACSVKSAKTGLANPLPTSTRSSSSSVPPKRNPASLSTPISFQRTTIPESRSQTRQCANSTSFPTNCLAAGTIPYGPLRM
jgi:hypothetical protein